MAPESRAYAGRQGRIELIDGERLKYLLKLHGASGVRCAAVTARAGRSPWWCLPVPRA
jgi:restriction endonuclease Mrr